MKYVGIRAYTETVNKAFPGVDIAGGSIMKHTRRACNLHGIKQKSKGVAIQFYKLTDEQFAELNDPMNDVICKLKDQAVFVPLLSFDSEAYSNAIESVNSKYGGRMDRSTYNRYEAEMVKAIGSIMTKANDEATAKTKFITISNKYKVHDLVGYGDIADGIITKVTGKTLEIANIGVDGHPLAKCFNWTDKQGLFDNHMFYDFNVAYESNRHLLSSNSRRKHRYTSVDHLPTVIADSVARVAFYYDAFRD